jgi:hypothetical protein
MTERLASHPTSRRADCSISWSTSLKRPSEQKMNTIQARKSQLTMPDEGPYHLRATQVPAAW